MISLPFGKSSIKIPDRWNGRATVLSPGDFPGTDPDEIVNVALDAPVGSELLEKLCRPGDRVACVIPDLTRRAAVGDYLPVLLRRLSIAGVGAKDITILVALGIHRSMTEAELRELVGDLIFNKYSVVNHDPDGMENNILLGTTDAGIPVEINRIVSQADCVVLTGGITYHYFAGYGGGRKSLLPGVASRQACEAHHKLVVSWRRGELDGVLSPGALADNPAHRQMIQACNFIAPAFVLNVITDPGGQIVAAAAGELEAAHLKACSMYDSWFRKELRSSAKLVLASAGGYPKDVNFIQAHKGLFAAHQAVSREGVVIFAADCPEGVGHSDFLGWFDRCTTEKKWLDELQAQYQINGQTAFSTWLKVISVPTVLVSRLNPVDVERMGMVPAGDMDEALEAAQKILGELPVPLVIPDAGDILPVIRSAGFKV